MSRFEPLNPEELLAGFNYPQSGSTPRASRAPTPAESHVSSRIPSPTEPLEPIDIPESWQYGGIDYQRLEDAIRASAQDVGIGSVYVDWVVSCFNTFVKRNLGTVYNQLGRKIYEHRHMQDEKNIVYDHSSQQTDRNNQMINGLLVRTENAENKLAQVLTENDVLNQSQRHLANAFNTLSHEFTSLKERLTLVEQQQAIPAPSTLNPAVTGNHRSRPKIAEPPKFKGNADGKGITLEQWLQKLGIW
ncbi:hypothetical protein OE88DRAFT_1618625, partial [Heliocybe sulcata]